MLVKVVLDGMIRCEFLLEILFIIIILCVGVLAACIIYPMMQKGLCNCLPCCFKDPKFSDNELKAASVVPVPAPPPKKKDFNLP